MGFNRVAFILNDFSQSIKDSPNTVVDALTFPYDSDSREGRECLWDSRSEHGERLHSQAIRVFPAFHADQTKFYMAGGNQCKELKYIIVEENGEKFAKIKLPEWVK